MNNQQDQKPEPMPAKSNWHYDSYFLSQLERLGLRKATAEHSLQEFDSKPPKIEVQSAEPTPLEVDSEDELQKIKREEVKAKIQTLADSIGISVNIIESIG